MLRFNLLSGAILSILLCFSASANAKPFNADHQLVALNKKPANSSNEPVVIMETNRGTIKIVIFRKDAPITAGNFLDLVMRGFYNGLVFHRYEPGFVIQGGDPQGSGSGGYVDPQTREERHIPLEIKPGLRHSEAGMLAMARTSDPNSASSQFYFTLAPAPSLDNGYAVFGKVIDGMQTVMALRKGDGIVRADVKEPGSK